MPNFSAPANVITGGVIQAIDVSALYADISGLLDNQNIKTGGLIGANLANNTVAIGQIKNALVSTGVAPIVGNHSNGLFLVLPSGAYSFFPGISTDASATTQATIGGWRTADTDAGFTAANISTNNPVNGAGMSWVKGNTTPQAIIWLAVINPSVTGVSSVATASCYYIQTSPPYDLGDGEIPLFVFALVAPTGDVVGTYIAHDPPWARPHTMKWKAVPKDIKKALDEGQADALADQLSQHHAHLQAIVDLRAKIQTAATKETAAQLYAQIQDISNLLWDMTPETQAEKNERMPKIPHPWILNNLPGHTVVMLDPKSPAIEHLRMLHASGEKVTELLHHGYVKIGNSHIEGRHGPHKVMVVEHGLKASKK